MRIKLSIPYSRKSLFLWVISFLLFAELINLAYFESSTYTLIQYSMLVPIVIYCFAHIKFIKRDQYGFLFSVAAMGTCIVLSTIYNQAATYNVRASIYYVLLMFSMCFLLVTAGTMKKVSVLLQAGKIYLLIVLAVNDLLMVALPNQFFNVAGQEIGTMLIGNKFNVAYAHLMLMFISVVSENNERVQRIKAIAYAVLLMAICFYVDCITVVLACWVFVLLYFLPKHIRSVLSKPLVFILIFLACGFLLLLFAGILTIPQVQYVLTNILHRDATLTGRMEVYPYIYMLFARSKWWGYGFGTDVVLTTSIWYANVQNALWDFVIRYGLITLVWMIVYMMLGVFRHAKVCERKRETQSIWLSFSMLYVFLFIGIGEIAYNQQFWFYIALVWVVCYGESMGKKARIHWEQKD